MKFRIFNVLKCLVFFFKNTTFLWVCVRVRVRIETSGVRELCRRCTVEPSWGSRQSRLSSCLFHLANMRAHFEMRMMDQTVGSRAVFYQADKDLEVHNDRVAKCFWLEEVRREYAVEKRQRGAISSVTFPFCFKIYVCESVFVCACLYTVWVPEEGWRGHQLPWN